MFVQGAFAQEGEPVISAAQQGNKTIFLLSGKWTGHATSAELTLSSASTIEKAAASKWWNSSENDNNSISFTLSETTNSTSIFLLYSNSTVPTFRYQLSIGSAEYSGTIEPIIDSEGSWYRNWTDNREGAMSAFIPEGWKADLQIVRPYNSMTGFVFFVRGEANALAYVFYPFMPLHILPEDQICEKLDTCNGVASTEKVQLASFGNAPVAVSGQKDPAQYFESEVLPLLRTNLEGYSVQSTDPFFALQYDSDNKATTRFLEGLQLSYNFDAQGTKIVGKAAVFISNQTTEESGYWNGVVIGVESSQESFEQDFQNATVTLLTLRLDEKWKTREQAVIDQSIEITDPAFKNVTKIIANTTLQDFDSILSTMAHALVRADASARIAAYNNTATGEEMHLPQYESTQHWYLQDEMLLGRKNGRNIMNSTAIEPLQR